MKPKPKRSYGGADKSQSGFSMKRGVPKKGYKFEETTTGRIPDPEVVPVKKYPKLSPRKAVYGGAYATGQPRTTVKKRAKSL